MIRKATQADKEWIVDCQIKLAQESEGMVLNQNTVDKGVQHILDNPIVGHYLICETDNRPAGMLMLLNEWSDWRAGNVLWIHSVYVSPDFRRGGIYTRLYIHVQQMVQSDPSLMGVRLFADKTNEQGLKTYQKLGMNGDHYQLFEWMK